MDIYPQGLFGVLMSLRRYRLPVIIAENGICTADDELRWKYIRRHLQAVRRAMEQGVPMEGYLYWSLLDNFEWDKGFTPRFGLIDVDYTTFRRTVRESARKTERVCETGSWNDREADGEAYNSSGSILSLFHHARVGGAMGKAGRVLFPR